MLRRPKCKLAILVVAAGLLYTNFVSAADAGTDLSEHTITLLLHAGKHDRLDAPVSVLIDAGTAQSVWVELPDGSLERSQLAEPGILNAAGRDKGKKELHFGVPKMAKDETLKVVAKLSGQPTEGRSYVWSGEPNQNRRLSCSQCHQGTAIPTGTELREERQTLERTGKIPPLSLPRLLPTAAGKDFRWHEKLGRYETSACWECHGRHMVQYEFGQSLGLPSTKNAADPAVFRNVYHKVFRTDGDVTFSPHASGKNDSSGPMLPCGIHYGFERATIRALDGSMLPHTGIRQQHAGILEEAAGKFIGRHCVLIHWVGAKGVLAKEERELTVKNTRARNGSRALWIDFVSRLSSTGGMVRLDGAAPFAGFQFVAPADGGTAPAYRHSTDCRAVTFVFEGTTYTAACFNHPTNPRALVEKAADRTERNGIDRSTKPLPAIGYSFTGEFGQQNPLFVHYRLWIQEGVMPAEEIQSMSNDFLEPVGIEVIR